MSFKSIMTLQVRLSDEIIGTVLRLEGDRHWFVFDESYIHNKQRKTLSLSFKSREGNLLTTSRPIQSRLPPFFSNLLPEGHLRTYLVQQLAIRTEQEFYLLSALGSDLPGAVKIIPTDFDFSHDIKKNYALQSMIIPDDPILRFSLAGIQFKFSAIMNGDKRLTIPMNGIGGKWIVKLPSTRFTYLPENEFAMLSLAREVGIPVPPIHLISMKAIDGLPQETSNLTGNAFVIERFDRTSDGQRIHMEDFAQVFGLFPERKYEKRNYANIIQVLSAETEAENVIDFFRRLIFSILIGNGDMHLKNWSLLYHDGINPTLAPAYDFVSTIPYLATDQLALNFGDTKNLHEITLKQINHFANATNLSRHLLQQLTEEIITKTIEVWKNLPEKSMLPLNLQESIGKHMYQVASFKLRLR